MGAPYSSTTPSGYNSNPPTDDGAATEANRGKWSTIKTKLTDPLNTFATAVNSAITAAFGKIMGGAGITSTAVNYTVVSTDQGKIVRATASAITITTPDATDVGTPFMFSVLNDSTGDITLDGSGSQTIDGDATVTIPANSGIILNTDGTNWFSTGQNFQKTQIVPQGYLTVIASATDAINPIPTSDQIGVSNVYFRPFGGNLLPVSDGTNFSIKTFSELTLALVTNHLASTIYDAFAFSDAGTIRIGTGPAWNNSGAGTGARGTGAGTTELVMLNGLPVNNVAITARNGSSTYSVAAKNGLYLGSILITATAGTVTCHRSYGQSRVWGVWNAYNRRTIILRAGDSTASWSYGTATIRASNNSSANSLTVFTGLAEEQFRLGFWQNADASANVAGGKIGIGWNSTTAFSGFAGAMQVPLATGGSTSSAQQITGPALGVNTVTSLELGGSNAATFKGGDDDMLLTGEYMG